MKINSHICTRVYIMRSDDGEGFWLYFYGLTARDLSLIPNDYIRAAIARRRLGREYSSSLFLVEEVRPRFQPNAVLRSMVDVGN